METEVEFAIGDVVTYKGQATSVAGPLLSRKLFRPRWKVPQHRPCHELSLRDSKGQPIYAEPWELTRR